MAAATKGSGRLIAVGTAVIIYTYNTYLIKLLIKGLTFLWLPMPSPHQKPRPSFAMNTVRPTPAAACTMGIPY